MTPTPGTPQYWSALRTGITLIHSWRNALHNAEQSGRYFGSDMDEDGEYGDIIENLGPWDRADAAMEATLADSFAVGVLRAHGLKVERGVVLKGGLYARARDIPALGGAA